MEVEVDENELKSVGAELFTDGRYGLRVRGWEIESRKRSILNCADAQQYLPVSLSASFYDIWEEKLQTSHFPEMVFGDSSLILKHLESGTKIIFNAFDPLVGWKHEGLPPVEVPAAAKWKFRRELVDAFGISSSSSMVPLDPFNLNDFIKQCTLQYGVPPRPFWFGAH